MMDDLNSEHGRALASLASELHWKKESANYIYNELYSLNAKAKGDAFSDDMLRTISTMYTEGDHETTKYKKKELVRNPGLIPLEYLSMPGLVDNIAQHTLETSVVPNPIMAQAGAIAFLSMLTGRKVTDYLGTMSNMYIIALGASASGKNAPRVTNKRLAGELGISSLLADDTASSEGLEDALFHRKVMLLQNDEFDNFLSASKSKNDTRFGRLMGLFLRMYSESGGIYNCRPLARDTEIRTIDSPSLTIFATCIPQPFYSSLTQKSLIDGTMSRFIVIEGAPVFRSQGQGLVFEDKRKGFSEEILEACKFWVEFNPGGSMGCMFPKPLLIEHTRDAQLLAKDVYKNMSLKYDDSLRSGDEGGNSVWGRAMETVNKWALGRCCSRDYRNPVITDEDVHAGDLVSTHQIERNFYASGTMMHDNDTTALVAKAVEFIESTNDKVSTRHLMARKLRLDSKSMDLVIDTMEDMGMVELDKKGRSTTIRLIR
jgi:hypothetical protein